MKRPPYGRYIVNTFFAHFYTKNITPIFIGV